MSVRRLAKEQPASFAFTPENLEKANWWIAKFPKGQRSAVIPLLWIVQEQERWVPEPALRLVAEMLAMPVIRVLECVTFYTMFQLEPVGRVAHVQVCGTPPCGFCGAGELMQLLTSEIGPKGPVSADGRFSWEEVECMGACANAPMVAINDRYFEDLDTERLGALLDGLDRGEHPEPGSTIGRQGAAPEGGPNTLTDEMVYSGARAKPIKSLPNAPEKEPA